MICRILFFFLLVTSGCSQKPAWAIPPTDTNVPGEGTLRRHAWFQRLWNMRRGKWANDVTNDQGAVVFLGDSITQHFEPLMPRAFPTLKTANRGISGDTTRGMLYRLNGDVLACNPKAVVLLMGTNDLEESGTPEEIQKNTKLITAALKKHDPKMPIILNLIFPSSPSVQRPTASLRKANALLRATFKDDPNVTIIDTWTLFADENGLAKKVEFPDLLHPNQKGYAKWTAALVSTFKALNIVPAGAE